MELDPVWERLQVVGEAVAPRHLEGDESHLPGPARRLKWLLEPADLEDVDRRRAQPDGAGDGDRVDDATVDVVLVVDLDRGEDPRHRARGEHGVGQVTLGEPVL